MRTNLDEYMDCISDLIELEDVKQLDEYSQHLDTSRLAHSMSVSYLSYRICKKFGWDYRSGARAGLLHDLYLYHRCDVERHVSAHPKIALVNARRIAQINEIEADAIVKHMWPMTISFPKYRESYAVTMADKLCATYEFAFQASIRVRRILQPAAV